MTIYIVQGKLGHGKGKFTIGKIREYMVEDRRVAGNMDVFLEHLCAPNSRRTYTRIPDRPTAEDLYALGHGNPDSFDEDRNGLLVLDEAGSWFNGRAHADKGRVGLMDWFLHARKLGWDVMINVQGLGMIDKQFRENLADVLVKCIRADKVRIPVVGQLLGKKLGRLPRFHVANFTLADMPGFIVDREFFRNDDLQAAYDTRQLFRADYPHGVHSLLSAWHLVGRHQIVQKRPWWAFGGQPVAKPVPKPKKPVMALLAKLPPDDAMRLASRYWRAVA